MIYGQLIDIVLIMLALCVTMMLVWVAAEIVIFALILAALGCKFPEPQLQGCIPEVRQYFWK